MTFRSQSQTLEQNFERVSANAEILAVDDDPLNIFVIDALLREAGIPCDSANSGASALKLIKERIVAYSRGEAPLYKLILLDYSMPGMDGPEVA